MALLAIVCAACEQGPPRLEAGDDLAAPADLGAPPDLDPGVGCSPTDPRKSPARLAVFPDEGEEPYAAVLRKAQKDIRLMVYIMGTGQILDTLLAKAKAGVPVRVILDNDHPANPKYAQQLMEAGVKVLWSDPMFEYMHAKVIVVDGREAILSSGNYSQYSIQSERNFAVTLDDPEDVADLAEIFDADWQRKAPQLACTRLLVSPVNAQARMVDLIKSATQTLLIESMQFAEREVRDAVAERKAAGVEVRALLADPAWIDTNTDAAKFLAERKIPARYLSKPGVHVKALVVDGSRAYTGSENLSWTSLTKNREVGAILTEPEALKTMIRTFETDWANATPF